MVQIRPANPADLPAVLAVHRDAFGLAHGEEIVQLGGDLLADDTAAPRLSLIAEADRQVVGHVLLTAATIEPAGHQRVVQLLAPLPVATRHQGRGIGSQLVEEALACAARCGVDLVFVLGHPGYYPRFGFTPAGVRGLEAAYPIDPRHDDAWMVRELTPGVLGAIRGRLRCAAALDHPKHWRE